MSPTPGRLYGRTIKLLAGIPGLPGREWTSDTSGGLQITAEVEKTDRGAPNKAKIQILNLSDDSIGFLRQPEVVVRLAAGYADVTPILFVGDVREVRVQRGSQETACEIEAYDGLTAYQNSALYTTFEPPLTNRRLISRLAEAMTLAIDAIPADLPEIDYQSPYTVAGPVRAALDEVIASSGARWSIQDGTLRITLDGQPTAEAAALISPSTGLVGYPETTKKGVKFTSLLNAQLSPRRFVRLECRDFQAFFICKKVTHRLDARGQTFYTEVEATEATT